KFVTTLKLSGCNLEQSSDTIRFHSLKKLELHRVRIGEQMVHKFISECPLVEDLILSLFSHFKRLCVSHAPKLKTLTIVDEFIKLEIFEIFAPSLQHCTLAYIRKSCMIDMVGCPQLYSLKLRTVDIEIRDLISKIPLLDKLIIQDCVEITEIVFSSNRLKDLQILQCYNMNGIVVDAPNLLSFGLECEDIPYRFSIKGGLLVLTWFKLIKEEFNGVAHQVKELSMFISIMISLDSFSLDEFRNRSPSLPREVENLIIDVKEVPPLKYAALLDCFLGLFSKDFVYRIKMVETVDQIYQENIRAHQRAFSKPSHIAILILTRVHIYRTELAYKSFKNLCGLNLDTKDI
ncbi:hypothetical protein Ddye_019675, partial [Dipteronia dyeriana]